MYGTPDASGGIGGLNYYGNVNPYQNQNGAQNGNWQTNPQAYGNPFGGNNIANAGAINQAIANAYRTNGYSSDEPVENAGIKVGEIIGWRMWNVKGEWLEAYSSGHIWAPEENMEGKVPDHGYEGIWSFKDKRNALKKMLEGVPTAYGSIKMWGKVVEHEIGYRAEFAKIISIDGVNLGRDSIFNEEKKKLLKVLTENYKVEPVA